MTWESTMNTELAKQYRLTFSRDEAMRITGITTSKLCYLEKQGIIQGLVLDDTGNRPAKRYTFEHLVEINSSYVAEFEEKAAKALKAKEEATKNALENDSQKSINSK